MLNKVHYDRLLLKISSVRHRVVEFRFCSPILLLFGLRFLLQLLFALVLPALFNIQLLFNTILVSVCERRRRRWRRRRGGGGGEIGMSAPARAAVLEPFC